MKLNVISMAIFLLVLSGCGSGSDNSALHKSDLYSYSYSVPDGPSPCSTGEHTFETRTAYCQALLDDDLNNNCAMDVRQEVYKENCEGVSFE